MEERFKPLLRYGTPELVDYIISRVSVSASGCWIWTGGKDGRGYGRINYHRDHRTASGEKIAGSAAPRAHVATFYFVNGYAPFVRGRSVLDHFICDNPACCNPWHVRPETHTKNVLRGTGPTAINKRKTHCPQGHEYTPENVKFVGPNKAGRRCKICFNADRSRRRRYLVKIGLHPHSRKKTITQQLRELSTSPPHNSADRV